MMRVNYLGALYWTKALLPQRVERGRGWLVFMAKVLTLETGLNHRVVQGYDAVVEHMMRSVDIRFGFETDTVTWSGDGVAVHSTDGRELRGRAAITTLPVGVLKSGKVRFVPALPPSKRQAFDGLPAGPVLEVLLRFGAPFWPRCLANLPCAVGPVPLCWPVFYGAAGTVPAAGNARVLLEHGVGAMPSPTRACARGSGRLDRTSNP